MVGDAICDDRVVVENTLDTVLEVILADDVLLCKTPRSLFTVNPWGRQGGGEIGGKKRNGGKSRRRRPPAPAWHLASRLRNSTKFLYLSIIQLHSRSKIKSRRGQDQDELRTMISHPNNEEIGVPNSLLWRSVPTPTRTMRSMICGM